MTTAAGTIRLNNGRQMPVIGLGAHLSGRERGGAGGSLGFGGWAPPHRYCPFVYWNEPDVGAAR